MQIVLDAEEKEIITHLNENVIVPSMLWKELIMPCLHGRDDKYELSDSRREPLSNHLKGKMKTSKCLMTIASIHFNVYGC